MTEPDVLKINVSTFIRLLEWAKESARDDMELHKLTENCIKKMQKVDIITMKDYRSLIPRRHKTIEK